MTYKPKTSQIERAELLNAIPPGKAHDLLRRILMDLDRAENLLGMTTAERKLASQPLPPRRIAVVFTVNPVGDRFKVMPVVNDDGDLQVGLLEDYPVRTFDYLTDATAYAKSQVTELCVKWMNEGNEVTAATVVTPTDCIGIDLDQFSE